MKINSTMRKYHSGKVITGQPGPASAKLERLERRRLTDNLNLVQIEETDMESKVQKPSIAKCDPKLWFVTPKVILHDILAQPNCKEKEKVFSQSHHGTDGTLDDPGRRIVDSGNEGNGMIPIVCLDDEDGVVSSSTSKRRKTFPKGKDRKFGSDDGTSSSSKSTSRKLKYVTGNFKSMIIADESSKTTKIKIFRDKSGYSSSSSSSSSLSSVSPVESPPLIILDSDSETDEMQAEHNSEKDVDVVPPPSLKQSFFEEDLEGMDPNLNVEDDDFMYRIMGLPGLKNSEENARHNNDKPHNSENSEDSSEEMSLSSYANALKSFLGDDYSSDEEEENCVNENKESHDLESETLASNKQGLESMGMEDGPSDSNSKAGNEEVQESEPLTSTSQDLEAIETEDDNEEPQGLDLETLASNKQGLESVGTEHGPGDSMAANEELQESEPLTSTSQDSEAIEIEDENDYKNEEPQDLDSKTLGSRGQGLESMGMEDGPGDFNSKAGNEELQESEPLSSTSQDSEAIEIETEDESDYKNEKRQDLDSETLASSSQGLESMGMEDGPGDSMAGNEELQESEPEQLSSTSQTLEAIETEDESDHEKQEPQDLDSETVASSSQGLQSKGMEHGPSDSNSKAGNEELQESELLSSTSRDLEAIETEVENDYENEKPQDLDSETLASNSQGLEVMGMEHGPGDPIDGNEELQEIEQLPSVSQDLEAIETEDENDSKEVTCPASPIRMESAMTSTAPGMEFSDDESSIDPEEELSFQMADISSPIELNKNVFNSILEVLDSPPSREPEEPMSPLQQDTSPDEDETVAELEEDEVTSESENSQPPMLASESESNDSAEPSSENSEEPQSPSPPQLVPFAVEAVVSRLINQAENIVNSDWEESQPPILTPESEIVPKTAIEPTLENINSEDLISYPEHGAVSVEAEEISSPLKKVKVNSNSHEVENSEDKSSSEPSKVNSNVLLSTVLDIPVEVETTFSRPTTLTEDKVDAVSDGMQPQISTPEPELTNESSAEPEIPVSDIVEEAIISASIKLAEDQVHSESEGIQPPAPASEKSATEIEKIERLMSPSNVHVIPVEAAVSSANELSESEGDSEWEEMELPMSISELGNEPKTESAEGNLGVPVVPAADIPVAVETKIPSPAGLVIDKIESESEDVQPPTPVPPESERAVEMTAEAKDVEASGAEVEASVAVVDASVAEVELSVTEKEAMKLVDVPVEAAIPSPIGQPEHAVDLESKEIRTPTPVSATDSGNESEETIAEIPLDSIISSRIRSVENEKKVETQSEDLKSPSPVSESTHESETVVEKLDEPMSPRPPKPDDNDIPAEAECRPTKHKVESESEDVQTPILVSATDLEKESDTDNEHEMSVLPVADIPAETIISSSRIELIEKKVDSESEDFKSPSPMSTPEPGNVSDSDSEPILSSHVEPIVEMQVAPEAEDIPNPTQAPTLESETMEEISENPEEEPLPSPIKYANIPVEIPSPIQLNTGKVDSIREAPQTRTPSPKSKRPRRRHKSKPIAVENLISRRRSPRLETKLNKETKVKKHVRWMKASCSKDIPQKSSSPPSVRLTSIPQDILEDRGSSILGSETENGTDTIFRNSTKKEEASKSESYSVTLAEAEAMLLGDETSPVIGNQITLNYLAHEEEEEESIRMPSALLEALSLKEKPRPKSSNQITFYHAAEPEKEPFVARKVIDEKDLKTVEITSGSDRDAIVHAAVIVEKVKSNILVCPPPEKLSSATDPAFMATRVEIIDTFTSKATMKSYSNNSHLKRKEKSVENSPPNDTPAVAVPMELEVSTPKDKSNMLEGEGTATPTKHLDLSSTTNTHHIASTTKSSSKPAMETLVTPAKRKYYPSNDNYKGLAPTKNSTCPQCQIGYVDLDHARMDEHMVGYHCDELLAEYRHPSLTQHQFKVALERFFDHYVTQRYCPICKFHVPVNEKFFLRKHIVKDHIQEVRKSLITYQEQWLPHLKKTEDPDVYMARSFELIMGGSLPSFVCNICGMTMRRNGRLHHLTTHGFEMLKCKFCNALFKETCVRTGHELKEHSELLFQKENILNLPKDAFIGVVHKCLDSILDMESDKANRCPLCPDFKLSGQDMEEEVRQWREHMIFTHFDYVAEQILQSQKKKHQPQPSSAEGKSNRLRKRTSIDDICTEDTNASSWSLISSGTDTPPPSSISSPSKRSKDEIAAAIALASCFGNIYKGACPPPSKSSSRSNTPQQQLPQREQTSSSPPSGKISALNSCQFPASTFSTRTPSHSSSSKEPCLPMGVAFRINAVGQREEASSLPPSGNMAAGKSVVNVRRFPDSTASTPAHSASSLERCPSTGVATRINAVRQREDTSSLPPLDKIAAAKSPLNFSRSPASSNSPRSVESCPPLGIASKITPLLQHQRLRQDTSSLPPLGKLPSVKSVFNFRHLPATIALTNSLHSVEACTPSVVSKSNTPHLRQRQDTSSPSTYSCFATKSAFREFSKNNADPTTTTTSANSRGSVEPCPRPPSEFSSTRIRRHLLPRQDSSSSNSSSSSSGYNSAGISAPTFHKLPASFTFTPVNPRSSVEQYPPSRILSSSNSHTALRSQRDYKSGVTPGGIITALNLSQILERTITPTNSSSSSNSMEACPSSVVSKSNAQHLLRQQDTLCSSAASCRSTSNLSHIPATITAISTTSSNSNFFKSLEARHPLVVSRGNVPHNPERQNSGNISVPKSASAFSHFPATIPTSDFMNSKGTSFVGHSRLPDATSTASMNSNSSTSAMNYPCQYCPLSFPNLNVMRDHVFGSHCSILFSSCQHPSLNRFQFELALARFFSQFINVNYFACPFCPMDFRRSDKLQFRRHLFYAHSRQLKAALVAFQQECYFQLQKMNSPEDAVKQSFYPNPNDFEFCVCKICGKQIYTKHNGQIHHLRTMHGYETLKCHYCEEHFGMPDSRRRHELRVHCELLFKAQNLKNLPKDQFIKVVCGSLDELLGFHEDIPKTNRCPLCPTYTISERNELTRAAWRVHMVTMHFAFVCEKITAYQLKRWGNEEQEKTIDFFKQYVNTQPKTPPIIFTIDKDNKIQGRKIIKIKCPNCDSKFAHYQELAQHQRSGACPSITSSLSNPIALSQVAPNPQIPVVGNDKNSSRIQQSEIQPLFAAQPSNVTCTPTSSYKPKRKFYFLDTSISTEQEEQKRIKLGLANSNSSAIATSAAAGGVPSEATSTSQSQRQGNQSRGGGVIC